MCKKTLLKIIYIIQHVAWLTETKSAFPFHPILTMFINLSKKKYIYTYVYNVA